MIKEKGDKMRASPVSNRSYYGAFQQRKTKIWEWFQGLFCRAPFGLKTPEERAAFIEQGEELDRLYGKDGYRPQPEGYTIDDLMKEVDELRKSGAPIGD